MTDYRLPPGMTAKNLRFIADDLRSHNFVVFASALGSWADAIDPPSESVVTDEVVEAVQDLTGPRAGAESYLADRRSLTGEGDSDE